MIVKASFALMLSAALVFFLGAIASVLCGRWWKKSAIEFRDSAVVKFVRVGLACEVTTFGVFHA